MKMAKEFRVGRRMPAAERGKDGERIGGFVGWMGLYSLSSTDDEQARLLFSWKDGLLSPINSPGAEWEIPLGVWEGCPHPCSSNCMAGVNNHTGRQHQC